eukprot:9177297-Pyramimonas_sp.AAC.2
MADPTNRICRYVGGQPYFIDSETVAYPVGNALVFTNTVNGKQTHQWSLASGSITAYAVNRKKGIFAMCEFALKPKVAPTQHSYTDQQPYACTVLRCATPRLYRLQLCVGVLTVGGTPQPGQAICRSPKLPQRKGPRAE